MDAVNKGGKFVEIVLIPRAPLPVSTNEGALSALRLGESGFSFLRDASLTRTKAVGNMRRICRTFKVQIAEVSQGCAILARQVSDAARV